MLSFHPLHLSEHYNNIIIKSVSSRQSCSNVSWFLSPSTLTTGSSTDWFVHVLLRSGLRILLSDLLSAAEQKLFSMCLAQISQSVPERLTVWMQFAAGLFGSCSAERSHWLCTCTLYNCYLTVHWWTLSQTLYFYLSIETLVLQIHRPGLHRDFQCLHWCFVCKLIFPDAQRRWLFFSEMSKSTQSQHQQLSWIKHKHYTYKL